MAIQQWSKSPSTLEVKISKGGLKLDAEHLSDSVPILLKVAQGKGKKVHMGKFPQRGNRTQVLIGSRA